jgi:hypothetical protein
MGCECGSGKVPSIAKIDPPRAALFLGLDLPAANEPAQVDDVVPGYVYGFGSGDPISHETRFPSALIIKVLGHRTTRVIRFTLRSGQPAIQRWATCAKIGEGPYSRKPNWLRIKAMLGVSSRRSARPREDRSMADYPYTPKPGVIKPFLEKLQTVGVPPRITVKWIEGLGFTSSNDRQLIGIVKAIGLTNDDGVPTDKWKNFRNKGHGRQVLAGALRTAYSGLFAVYPDAHRKDDEALRNFFASQTNVSQSTVALMVRTFKVLTELADFDDGGDGHVPVQTLPAVELPAGAEKTAVEGKQHTEIQVPGRSGVTINLNIQLQLPETVNGEIYDRLFEAMKKHLLS